MNRKQKLTKSQIIGLVSALLIGIIAIVIGIRIGSNEPTEQPSLASGNTAANSVFNKKVQVIIYNPILRTKNNQKLNQYYGWADPDAMVAEYLSWMRETSRGRINYEITSRTERDGYLVKEDGHLYTEQEYLECVESGPAGPGCHRPDIADYSKILDTNDSCEKVNAGEADEIWLIGGPWFGFYESRLAGPGAYFLNSGPLNGTTCNRMVPIMGYNFERGIGELAHSNGHRMESTMRQVYGSWEQNRMDHNWDKFALNKLQSPSYSKVGCGSVHYPPNATFDYDYTNNSTVDTYCGEFDDYPEVDVSNATAKSCTAWDCTQAGYFRWWFRSWPRFTGFGPDGKFNDWWVYFIEPNTALTNQLPVPSATLPNEIPTNTPVPTQNPGPTSTNQPSQPTPTRSSQPTPTKTATPIPPSATPTRPITPSPTLVVPAGLPEDLNDDRKLDIRDFIIFRDNYIDEDTLVDFNDDEVVNIADFSEFTETYKEYN